MGMMRRLIAVGVGLAAGAAAATVLKKLNDPILDEDEVMIPPQQPEGADETVEAPAAAEEPAEEPAREPAAPAAEEGKAEEPRQRMPPMQTPFSWAPPRPRWARTASWTPPALPLRRISATGMTWAAADKQNQYGLLCASRSKRVRRAAHCVFAGRAGWRNR